MAPDEEAAGTGDAGGATADAEPADEADAGYLADTADNADTAGYDATYAEEPGDSEEAADTATDTLPADAAAGTLPANDVKIAERGSSARLSSPGRKLKAVVFG